MIMKNCLFVALMGLVMSTLCGCGNKSVTGADGREYDSYQSACRNQDFVAAYDWIEKNNGSEEDKDYVFNAEMLYLTSLGTEEASNRIVYLLAEYQIPGTPVTEASDTSGWHYGAVYEEEKKYILGIMRFNKRCDNVLDIAISQRNEPLCKKIISLYKSDIKWKDRGDDFWLYGLSWQSKENAKAKVEAAFSNEEIKE